MSVFVACVFAVGQYPTIAPEPVAGIFVETPAVERFYPVIAPSPVQFISPAFRTAPQFSYSMVYNIEGDWHPSTQKIASHISSVHGINPAGMSRAEMLAAHDRAHGVGGARVSVVRRPAVQYSATPSCPGGICPVGKRRRA